MMMMMTYIRCIQEDKVHVKISQKTKKKDKFIWSRVKGKERERRERRKMKIEEIKRGCVFGLVITKNARKRDMRTIVMI